MQSKLYIKHGRVPKWAEKEFTWPPLLSVEDGLRAGRRGALCEDPLKPERQLTYPRSSRAKESWSRRR